MFQQFVFGNWSKLYESILKSIGKYKFELILVGPIANQGFLNEHKETVIFIKDFGSATRCQQISCINASRGIYHLGAR